MGFHSALDFVQIIARGIKLVSSIVNHAPAILSICCRQELLPTDLHYSLLNLLSYSTTDTDSSLIFLSLSQPGLISTVVMPHLWLPDLWIYSISMCIVWELNYCNWYHPLWQSVSLWTNWPVSCLPISQTHTQTRMQALIDNQSFFEFILTSWIKLGSHLNSN